MNKLLETQQELNDTKSSSNIYAQSANTSQILKQNDNLVNLSGPQNCRNSAINQSCRQSNGFMNFIAQNKENSSFANRGKFDPVFCEKGGISANTSISQNMPIDERKPNVLEKIQQLRQRAPSLQSK